MSYKFSGNIYNPDGPEATTKLLSENYGRRCTGRKAGTEEQVDVDGLVLAGKITPPPSPEGVVRYVKGWLKDKVIGKPIPPSGSGITQEELIEMGYIGVFSPTNPPNRHSAPSTGTGTGTSGYPRCARHDSKGNIIEVIDFEHRI